MAWSFAGRKNGTEHVPRIALTYAAKIEALIGQPGFVQPQLFHWWKRNGKKYAKLRSTNTGSTSTRSLNRKPHPAKPGSVFPRLSPKRLSLPSWTETQFSVTPSFPEHNPHRRRKAAHP